MTIFGRKGSGAGAGALALALLIVASVGAAGAVTYVQIPDEVLFQQADVIAEVSIVGELPPLAGAVPITQYQVSVETVIKGSVAASTLVVSSPGGVAADGRELVVPGAPRFAPGDRVLAFLTGEEDTGYGLLHLGMGAFHRVGSGSRFLAVRPFAGEALLDSDLEPAIEVVRDYDRFVRWLERRQRGVRKRADYFLPRARFVAAPYRLVKVGGKNVRWFEFDDCKTVDWRSRNTTTSNTQPLFVQALNVWSRDPVSLRLVGGTNSTSGLLRSDNVNAIIFGDPNNSLPGTFVCPNGGVIGLVGFWLSNQTGRYEGRQYTRLREADIVINDGTECLLNNNRLATAELFTMELGFSLGIDISDKANATMGRFHNDGRGASLTADDIAALEALYGSGTCSDPGPGPDPDPDPDPDPKGVDAPSKLKVKTPKATRVRLRWKDNSKDETQFEIWRRIGEKKWKLWETKPANKRSMKSKDVRAGATYTFRVRARRGDELSEFSNEVTVTMPLGKLAAPENLEVEATSPTTGLLTWEDKTDGEKLFKVERREGDGEWASWRTADANATMLEFDDGVSGATYSFRIRAKKGSKVSDFSNEATVTMP
ncbi:MAG: fibronectin type III domain-containing protein [Thermoanaerobaculia bacterium]